jgi:hypothetical protein
MKLIWATNIQSHVLYKDINSLKNPLYSLRTYGLVQPSLLLLPSLTGQGMTRTQTFNLLSERFGCADHRL